MVSGTPTILTTTPQKIQVAAPVQKIITSKSQLLNPGASPTPKVLRTASNLQQLLSQGTSSGQKIILNQANATGQRFIISTASHQPVQQTIQAPKTIIQPQQQILVNPAQPQKLVQQYVNSTDQQQQILVGGQRILLNPGQRIITQHHQPQQPQQQIIQQIQQPQLVQAIQQQQQQQLQQQTDDRQAYLRQQIEAIRQQIETYPNQYEISVSNETYVNYKHSRPPINPNAEFIEPFGHGGDLQRLPPPDANRIVSSQRQPQIEAPLHKDILVNYKYPLPTINPDSELLPQFQFRNFRRLPSSGPTVVQYKLPGDQQAGVYFYTPQEEPRK